MTFRSANRKRRRTNEELDFMPISKKMNDLHIRSNHANSQGLENNWHYLSTVQETGDCSLMSSLLIETIYQYMEKKVPNGVMQCNSHSVLEPQENGYCNNTSVVIDNIYAPELNSTQNPYYYHINSILYEAHLLRLQRLSKGEIANSNTKTN